LVGQRRQFDLHSAFMGAGPLAENLQDQAGTVDNLRLPAPFEIALLHWAQRGVDDNDPDFILADQLPEGFDSAAAQKSVRARASDGGDFGTDYVEADRLGETDSLFQTCFERTARIISRVPSRRCFRSRM
jgi:hypothetical protein